MPLFYPATSLLITPAGTAGKVSGFPFPPQAFAPCAQLFVGGQAAESGFLVQLLGVEMLSQCSGGGRSGFGPTDQIPIFERRTEGKGGPLEQDTDQVSEIFLQTPKSLIS